jgi:hypothetical protein
VKPRKSTTLEIITEMLEKEKPVILHDVLDGGGYFLLLKGLSEVTLDKDTSNPTVLQNFARFIKSIGPVSSFLQQTGLMSDSCACDTLFVDGHKLTALEIPGGKQAVNKLRTLYQREEVPNPFTEIEVTDRDEHKLLETIFSLQEIGQGQRR